MLSAGFRRYIGSRGPGQLTLYTMWLSRPWDSRFCDVAVYQPLFSVAHGPHEAFVKRSTSATLGYPKTGEAAATSNRSASNFFMRLPPRQAGNRARDLSADESRSYYGSRYWSSPTILDVTAISRRRIPSKSLCVNWLHEKPGVGETGVDAGAEHLFNPTPILYRVSGRGAGCDRPHPRGLSRVGPTAAPTRRARHHLSSRDGGSRCCMQKPRLA